MPVDNKQLIQDSFEKLNSNDLKGLQANVDPAVFAALSEKAARARTAFPDLKITVNNLIAEGDQVVASWTVSGTHKGKVMQAHVGEVEPTNKPMKINGVSIHRVSNGKIVSSTAYGGELDALRQLGLADTYAKHIA
jgi:predicted ester cyclase